jgi:hypothetical protein
METAWRYKNCNLLYHLWKYTVESTEVGGPVWKQLHEPVTKYGLYVQQTVSTKIFQFIVNTCGKMMEAEFTVLLINEDLG